jgi:serine/threonine-protein kinase
VPYRPEGIAKALGDRYTVEGDIGEGAVATVHLARDLKHHRQVAVKVLRPDVADAIAGDRFLQEIEIAARLNHPHVVPLFDSGRYDGLLFYVMPFQEGESLRDRLEREGPLPLEEAVALARDVAEALDYAHSQGVIHRDIKPANILISRGHALVADFGVARAVTTSAKDRLTSAGLTLGTPAYMSPEQAAGREDIDPRSDLYSLGCVLYEMLGGEPPFPGKTPQSVIARHISEPPLPLSALRQSVPRRLEKVVQKALAKAPADRFRSAAELRQALEDPRLLGEAEGERLSRRPRPLSRNLAILLLLLVGAGTGWAWWELRPPPLDPNKVLVFPLSDRGGGGADGGDVALWIVSTLEHAEPLRPVDAWDRLAPEERANIDLLPHDRARSLARASRAGHFLTGAITRSGDSLGVSLVLHATEGDSVVDRRTAFSPVTEEAPSQLGLRATVGILPRIIDPERELDLSILTERDPTAIVHWIHGEREYRLSHFEEALDFYEEAVEEDSLLALAALKGGQAASWVKDTDRAEHLLEVGLRHAHLLPPRHLYLGQGLKHFTDARPDSAVQALRMALAEDQEWAEAWMALGEVYHHLFPQGLVVDSTDIACFRRAETLDPGFLPPLLHMTETAIRQGYFGTAQEYLARLSRAGAYPVHVRKIQLMLQCATEGPGETPWADAVALNPGMVLDAGLQLAVGGYRTPCAKEALRALLAQEGVPDNLTWGAMSWLQGVLVAEGRYPEALAVLDSAQARGYGEAQYYILLGTLAGAPWEDRGEEIQAYVEDRLGVGYRGTSSTSLWVLGSWHAFRGERVHLQATLEELGRKVREGDPQAPPLAAALEAQSTLLAGDTAAAVEQLRRLRPTAEKVDLAWNPAASLPFRHLTLARLLLAGGLYAEALRVASLLDHPEPVAFPAFMPESLRIRRQAARALGRIELSTRYEQRLLSLGHASGAGAS